MSANEDGSRDRGFLSPSDRRYLRDPEQYAEDHSRQSVNERQRAIKTRIHNAILDFSDAFEHLDATDRDSFLEEALDEHPEPFVHGLIDALAFLYELHWVADGLQFEDSLQHAIRTAHGVGNAREGIPRRRVGEGYTFDPDLESVEEDDAILEQARDKAQRGDALSLDEIGLLALDGYPIEEWRRRRKKADAREGALDKYLAEHALLSDPENGDRDDE